MLSAHRIASRMPQPLVRQVGRAVARHRTLDRLVRRSNPQGPVRIPRGAAAGMRVWSGGRVNLGYTLGTTEPAVQAALVAHLRPGGVCYDIGANVGFHTLIAARIVGPAGHVYAFEPLPENVSDLQRNVALNALENVSVIEVAVSDRSGSARLELGASSLDPRLTEFRENPGEAIDVRTVKLDELDIRPATLVKIDAEGAEYAVLEGMSNLLRAHRPVVLCEMHEHRDTHLEDVSALVGDGYSVRFLEDGVDADFWAPHVLAVPFSEG